MTFDPRSLEQLRSLGRQLPQELPKPKISQKQKNDNNSKRHPVETETDPQTLFQELIKASSDGNVPSHLLARLKEIESKQQHHKITQPSNTKPNTIQPHSRKKKAKEVEE